MSFWDWFIRPFAEFAAGLVAWLVIVVIGYVVLRLSGVIKREE